MPRALLANNAVSTLSAAITSTSATTMTVVSGATFPVPTGVQYYYLTLLDSANVPEIVKVTNLVSNTFTIVRAQDNTSARTFLLGAKVSLNLTAAAVNELAPLTGEGTSGTWQISISGNATTATSAATAAAYSGTLAAIGAAPLASPTFTGTVTASNFSGPLTGNVVGNLNGNATSATNATAAQVATTQASTDNSTNIATTAMVQSAGLGGNTQTWQAHSPALAMGTTYYNTTGKPIVVSVVASHATGGVSNWTINGVNVGTGQSNSLSANNLVSDKVIPAGASYAYVQQSGIVTTPTAYVLK